MENGTSYWTTGTFDEKTNTFVVADGVGALGDPTQRADYGEFYSSKTFVGSPLGLTLIGWIGEEGGPMKEWAGVQSIPRLVTLDPEHKGRVVFNPLPALTTLRIKQGSVSWTKQPLSPSTSVSLKGITAPLVDISLDFQGPFTLGTRFGVRLAQYEYPTATDGVTVSIVVDQSSPDGWAVLDVDGRNGTFPLPNNNAALHLRVLIDTSVVEAFAGNGRAVVTRRFYRGPDERSVSVFNEGGEAVVVDLEAYEMERPKALGVGALREVAERSVLEEGEVVMGF